MSTLIPIFLISELWPKIKVKPLLGKTGTVLVLLGMAAAVAWGAILPMGGKQKIPFTPDPMLLFWSFVSVGLLIVLAYRFRGSRLKTKIGLLSPAAILVLAFIFQLGIGIVPGILAGAGVPAGPGICIYVLFAIAFALFAASQLLNEKAGKRHFVAYASGSVLTWIFISLLFGLGGRYDLLISAPIALVLLYLWARKVLKA